jgi:hypothetical protein
MWAKFFKSQPDADSGHFEPARTRARPVHRKLAIVFTLTVLANFIAMAFGPAPPWIVYSPLPFLILLMGTGLYMFALPYVHRRRSAR